MRRMLRILAGIVLLMAAYAIEAQTAYQVTLMWTASASQCASDCTGDTGPTLINVYRSTSTNGGCSGSVWSLLATAQPPAGPYVDASVQSGTDYCYEIKAYFVSEGATVESGGSNWAYVPVPAAKPAIPAALSGKISVP